MFPRSGLIAAFAVALVAAGSGFAADNKVEMLVIKGTVIGDNGKPQDGAEVKAQRLDGKVPEKVAVTNERGQYMLIGLPIGDYSVTAYFNGFPRSRAIIKSASKGWAKVNFDLGLDKGEGDGGNRWNNDIRTVRWYNVGNPH